MFDLGRRGEQSFIVKTEGAENQVEVEMGREKRGEEVMAPLLERIKCLICSRGKHRSDTFGENRCTIRRGLKKREGEKKNLEGGGGTDWASDRMGRREEEEIVGGANT